MAEIIIQNIDPDVLQQLEGLAALHGRSLQAEIKRILEAAAQERLSSSPEASEIVYQKALQMQEQLKNHSGEQSSSETGQINASLNRIGTIEQLKNLKRTISSLQGLSIREAIEEGRRF